MMLSIFKDDMERLKFKQEIASRFQTSPAVAVLGPRQCGKTTLVRDYIADYAGADTVHFFDLENPLHLEKLAVPMLALGRLQGTIVLDEIQRRPDLFPVLRVLIDEARTSRKFLILGSASRLLIQQSSETLAGRISYLELTPFQFNETGEATRLWERGGFPPAYLAPSEETSQRWRLDYVRTFLEQDIPNLGIRIPANNLRRFWAMLAHYHGNIVNYSEIGSSLDLNHATIKRYVDLLHETFMIRVLQPWYENIAKRQVKSPKTYFRDSGIFHTLLGIDSSSALHHHPKLGASWEGFALEEIMRVQDDGIEAFFWSSYTQAELDLLLVKGQQRIGIEFKYTDTPRKTKSMIIACSDLKLDRLWLIYPGQDKFPMDTDEKIWACGLEDFLKHNYAFL
jgi:predicted AAA+ superfamily ATPase